MKDQRLADLIRGEVTLGPKTIHIDVTNGCNTNCVTCWDHSPLLDRARPAAWKRQRVDPATVEEILDDAARLGGLEAVIVSGMGEPFTHPEIDAILRAITSRGRHVTVITNLVAADADRILDLGVDELLIGIHGASERAYLDFHPSFGPAEWRKLLAMLERFAGAGRRFKHVQVVSRQNAHELPEMVELGARYRARQVNFKLASLKDGTEACGITEEQRSALVEDLVPAARERATRLGVATNLDVFAAQLAAGAASTASIADVGCFMGHYYARILVDGTVLYCCNTEVVVGSLASARLSELWVGPRWSALRARLRRGDYLPGCSQCGKLNQNVALARRLEASHGAAALRAVTGRA